MTYLPVNEQGLIDLKDLEKAITEKTTLVSIMFVNNEIGVRQPIEEIGKICREKKVRKIFRFLKSFNKKTFLQNFQVFFHTDAAQGIGKIPINVAKTNIDLMSISGHKIYGPKGVGAIYVRRRPRVRLEPIFSGGGQERGMRSGTVPTPLVVGLGKACELCNEEMEV